MVVSVGEIIERKCDLLLVLTIMFEYFDFKEEDNPLWEGGDMEEIEPDGFGSSLATSFKMSLLQL